MRYDPDLTFEANGLKIAQSTGPYLDISIAKGLQEAYEDGWHDARAHQLAGEKISEFPDKF